ncbi:MULTISPECIES: CHAT domain-containing tetratricopeptide repeat protein [unclassified Bradyrhizobium]|uniref:CHAT domain-containing tetratricopeptide repeat protein n=1 Tax=unclassified Bradyrhizobium TaxID=2631580 RepID=UPI0020B1B551|nr:MULTISPECIES: CHAT domain-containing tetratricopeptide repeat protein [unclassified Bradyrhizobium]MCP3385108.1 CHAT domain-containing protein [Bradyrhizobium sp. CCGUVB4N]MCP3446371.1 CHAT domain-containing protein [Bradyrhizobium sp. CCGUVB14]
MSRARLFAALFLAALTVSKPATAQRGNDFDSLLAQMNAATQGGHWAEGLAAAQKLENLVRRRQGADNMNYAGVLHNEGMFLHNLGRFGEAADKLNAALAIKLRNNDVASTLRTSNILVGSLGMLDRRAEATTVAERALALGTSAFGANDVRLSDTLAALGGLARDKENYREAAGYFERALTGLQAANAPPVDIASAMDNLGDTYGLQGRFDDSERLLQQGIALLDRSFGGNAEAAPNYDKMLNDLGNLYLDAGRLSDAEATMRRALAITRTRSGDAHPNVAATMGNLATVLEHEARYVEAEKLYQQTLQVYERIYGANHPTTAIGLNNLANVYSAQGKHEAAAGLQERVLAIDEKAFGADSPDVGRALNNLANSYASLGRSDQALGLYRRSLAVMERKFGEGSGPSALAAGSLGQALMDAGKTDEARPYLVRCLEIDERALGATHPQLIKDLRAVALLDLKTGQLAEARSRLERALAIAQDKLGSHHQDTIATLINLADVDRREGKWPESLAKLRLAAATLNAERNAQFTRFTDIDPWLIEGIWRVSDGKPDAMAKDEAFGAAQRAHETKAGAALSQMAARFGAGNDAIAGLVRRQQDLKASLDTLSRRVTSELAQADGKRNDTLLANLRAQASQAQKSLDDVTAQLDRSFPAYAELSNPQPLPIAQTQGLLKPDEALVAFITLSDKTYAFAVTREASALRQIALDSRKISDRVAHLRQGLSDPEAVQSAFDLDASFELYSGLFGPIAADIAGKPKLLIVPAGALTSLPFQVLVTKKPDGASPDRYRQAAWLLNERAITVLPSVPSLRALRSLARDSRAQKPFIGFGDPILQRSPGDKRPGRNVQPYQNYYEGSAVDLERLRTGLPALPETAGELRAVAKALGASPQDDVKLGAAATVTSVNQLALDQYRVVDFATHGLVAGEVNGLSEPALVLTLPDRPTSDDDGLLTASRIAKLKLDADWAVLSACNTAAGDQPGAEGLSGLARAFFYAGARALLVSHWPVDSDAAVRLTTGAFSELSAHPGIGRAEALRRSMKELIADRSSPRNADPAVWAPFVLVGEGG